MDNNLQKQKDENSTVGTIGASLVSVDLTADACMETFWNDSRRPSPSLVKLKAKAAVHHSKAPQAHLQEHAIRLSLQHSAKNKKQYRTKTSDISFFVSSPLDTKTSAPTDQFYGTVWEGLPPLPNGANVFNSGSKSPEYFKGAKKHQDSLDKLVQTGKKIAPPITSSVKTKIVESQAKKVVQRKSEQISMNNLVESFPVNLRPAVIELSNAISCLTPSEIDELAESADWRSRKLIRMVAAAKFSK